MKYAIILFTALMVGCSTFEKIGDFVSENDLLVSVAARQAVAKYISQEDTVEAEKFKAKSLIAKMEVYKDYIDSDQFSTVEGLIGFIKSTIPWDRMSTEDKMTIENLVIIFSEIVNKKQQENELSEDTKIGFEGLF